MVSRLFTTGFALDVPVFFAKADLTRDFAIRLGRIQLPAFMSSDYRDVGVTTVELSTGAAGVAGTEWVALDRGRAAERLRTHFESILYRDGRRDRTSRGPGVETFAGQLLRRYSLLPSIFLNTRLRRWVARRNSSTVRLAKPSRAASMVCGSIVSALAGRIATPSRMAAAVNRSS
jgi:hypothetical protein